MNNQPHSPKLEEQPVSNTEKDPKDWVSGNDPITGAQASYLTTLSEEAGIDAPIDGLTKAQASEKIDELRDRLGCE